jgi:predicted DNA-binding protein
MGKPQIAVRIPPFLLEKLNSYTECSGTSKTEVVVSALADYLECAEDVPISKRIVELEKRVTILEALTRTN